MISAFKLYGGETGYIKNPNIEQVATDLQEIVKGFNNPYRTAPKRFGKSLISIVERGNNVIENTARYTAFKAVVQNHGGLDVVSEDILESAADLSKTLTINFNKRGTSSPYVSALYAFFNPQVQGSVVLLRGIAGKQGISKPKVRMLQAYFAMGFFGALWNILSSDEDEDGRLVSQKIP